MSAPSDVLPGGRLEERFADKKPPYSAGEALAEASRCLYCFDAPCIKACPTHIDIPVFIRKISTGNLEGSARTILEANLLGASCARVCPVEVLCEGACVYTGWGRQPIAIGRLQRYAMDHGQSTNLLSKAPPSSRSVGLVGAGPASLACAGTLVLLGHQAVIYEREALPGGLNSTGVAPYKLPVGEAIREIGFIRSLGVEIRTGVEVGKDLSAAELLRRHDAIFLGVGLGPDSRLGVPGEKGPGVIGAAEWIRRMKTEPGFGLNGIRSAVVVGGGNTAIDVVRELAQLGVPQVRLVYRRTEQEMKAYRHEWEAAKKEGAVLVPCAVVTEIVRERGQVVRVKLAQTAGGRPTGESLEPLPAELVVAAIGQAKLRSLVALFPGVALDEQGRIVVDPASGQTGNSRVFAGGDAANGGKEVVNAVAEGQLAARAMDALLLRPRDDGK
jgi:glutamate synthase (NADPH/NADH) small chain